MLNTVFLYYGLSFILTKEIIDVQLSSNSSSDSIKIKYGPQKQHQQESLETLGWAQFAFFKLRLAYQDVRKPGMHFLLAFLMCCVSKCV